MPDDLYHRDIVAWSAAQAERLRRLAAGERVNDLDWANVIEEIESVGRSEEQAVQSLLLQALIHAMKVAAWSGHDAAGYWRHECGVFLVQAQRRAQPSMVARLDIEGLHEDALRTLRGLKLGGPPAPLPQAAPYTARAVMDRATGADDLIALLAEGAGPG